MSGKEPPTEIAMRELLTRMGQPFEEQALFAGHRIDFLLQGGVRPVCLDTNGDRWHSWGKIVACDRIKIRRVVEAGGLPLGVWWSRLQRSEEAVWEGVQYALTTGCLPWWDWKVWLSDLPVPVRSVVEGWTASVAVSAWRPR